MALSGSVTTGAYSVSGGTRSVTLNWTATQSIANNTSTVSWTLSGSGTYSGWVRVSELSVTINGSNVYYRNSSNHTNCYNGTQLASGTTTISHNNDGTKSFTISISAGIYEWAINKSGSATFTLNAIPRASTISNAPSGYVLGNNIPISWTPKTTSYKYLLKITYGSYSKSTSYISPNTTSSYTYQLPTELSIANYVTNSTSVTLTITLYTYSGSTQIGNASSITTKVSLPTTSAFYPTMNSATFTIYNSNSTINGWNVAVAGYTSVNITAKATGAYGSTISRFDISGGYNTSVSGTSLSYNGAVITTSGSKKFTVAAIDTRGRSSNDNDASYIYSETFTFYGYSKPSVTSFEVYRDTSNANVVYAKANWNYSTVNNNNNATCTLKYKKHSSTSWSTYGTLSKNTSTKLTTSFDETYSYDFKITVTDTLGNSSTAEGFISTQEVTLDYRAGGKGFGIGKIAESDKLEVGMQSIFYDDIDIKGSMIIEGASDFSNTATFSKKVLSTRTDIGYWQERSDTSNSVGFGIGTGGVNRGIYDGTKDEWIICRNSSTANTNVINGNTTINGNIYANNITYSGYKSLTDKSISSGGSEMTTLGSVSLTAGIYYFEAVVAFYANGNGIREIDVAYKNSDGTITNLGVGWFDSQPATSGFRSYLRVGGIVNTSSYPTLYIRGYQNSGSSLTCYTRYCYLRFR